MPAFGTVLAPVRSQPGFPIEVNQPDGFPHDYPPGDLWWTGLHSDWQGAMPPGVTRATAIITNPLVRMPWTIVRPTTSRSPSNPPQSRIGRLLSSVRSAPGETVLAPGDPGYPTWLVDPQLANGSSGGANTGRLPQLDRGTRFDVLSRWLRDALWLGMGVLAAQLDSDGLPLAGTVQNIDPTRLYRGQDGWALDVGGHVEPVDEHGMVLGHRLILLRHSLPGGVLGWHRTQLRLSQRMTAYASETFDSGIPSGVLFTDQPLNQTQADASRTEWQTRQNTRSIAVLGNGTRYQPVAISPVDSELIAMGRASNESLAHAFELPAWYLDASTNTMTYNNAGWYRQDLVDGPLASWSARIEETVSALLPWGTRMSIDFTAYTRPIGEGVSDDAPAAAA